MPAGEVHLMFRRQADGKLALVASTVTIRQACVVLLQFDAVNQTGLASFVAPRYAEVTTEDAEEARRLTREAICWEALHQ